jgi:hypothetical protein
VQNEVAGEQFQIAVWFDNLRNRWNLMWCCLGYGEGGGYNSKMDITWRPHAVASMETPARKAVYTTPLLSVQGSSGMTMDWYRQGVSRIKLTGAWATDAAAWASDTTYAKGNVVTHEGLQWIQVREGPNIGHRPTLAMNDFSDWWMPVIGKLLAHYQPIIAFGDSYMDGEVNGAKASKNTTALFPHPTDTPFKDAEGNPQPRFCLHAAVGGNTMVGNVNSFQVARHTIHARYGNSFREGVDTVYDGATLGTSTYSVIGRHDLCEFVKVVFFMANGPSVNDISGIGYSGASIYGQVEDSVARETGRRLVSRMTQYMRNILYDITDGGGHCVMANVLDKRGNEVFVTDMVYRPTRIINNPSVKQEYIDIFNAELAVLCNTLKVPMARTCEKLSSKSIQGMHDYGDGDNYLWSGGFFDPYRRNYADIHLNQAGYNEQGRLGVVAYLTNDIPNLLSNDHTTCDYQIAGDVNTDCEVDLEDLMVLAANWLVGCMQEPDNP